MIEASFPGMGTSFQAVVAEPSRIGPLRSFVEECEQRMSRFRLDSELSRLNGHSPGTTLVSPELADCLTVAAELRGRTGGLVDAGCGAAVVDWGYRHSFGPGLDLPEPPSVFAAPEWSIEGRVVRRSPTTLFDLGGVAKGWTADRAVEAGLAEVVSAGGDVRSALPDTVVGVLDPWGSTVASVILGSGGLATSSVSRRRWRVASETVHHILNPLTGAPARTPILSATALAATAAEAEAAAKTVLILGEGGLAWASRQPWVRAALVVWEDGIVYATTGLELAA